MADFVKLNGYNVKDNVARPRILNLEIVNVKDYGAMGNGIADDTAAIQNALNDGVGKMVYIPSGTYNVSDTLIFKSNTYIKGCNKFNTIIKMTEDKDILKSEYYDQVTGTNPTDDICRNFILEGFCLDGGYILNFDTMAKTSKYRGNGLLIFGNKYEIRDLRVINNPRTGVKLEFTNNWTTNNEKEKFEWLSRAINDKQKIEKMRDKPVEGKNELNKAIGDYCFWLKTLYGKEYFTYKNTPR